MQNRNGLVHRAFVLVVLFGAIVGLLGCKKLFRKKYTPYDAGSYSSTYGTSTYGTSTAADIAADSTPPFKSVSGGFSVRFPSNRQPEIEDKSIAGGLSTLHFFKVQAGMSAYIIGYNDLPSLTGRTPKKVLDDARDGALASVGGTLDEENVLNLDGNVGRELKISATKSGISLKQRLRMYLVNKRLYQAIVVVPSMASDSEAQQDAFFESFALLSSKDAGKK
jgi:hypothetical protein